MPKETHLGFVTIRKETEEEIECSLVKARADHDTLVMAVLDCPDNVKQLMEKRGADLSEMQNRAFRRWIDYQRRIDTRHFGRELMVGRRRVHTNVDTKLITHPELHDV